MKRKFLLTTAFAAFGMMYDAASAMYWNPNNMSANGGQPGQPPQSSQAGQPADREALFQQAAGVAIDMEEPLEAPRAELQQGNNVQGVVPAAGAVQVVLDPMDVARDKVLAMLGNGDYNQADDYFNGAGANAFGFANMADANVSTLGMANDGVGREPAGWYMFKDLGDIELVCMAINGSETHHRIGLHPRNYRRVSFVTEKMPYSQFIMNDHRHRRRADKNTAARNPGAMYGQGTVNNLYLLLAALTNAIHRIDSAGVPERFGSGSLGAIQPYGYGGPQYNAIKSAIQTLVSVIRRL